jgi:hypothetical protein
MVSNLSQYSPQGLASQFPGLQGAGWPQMSPGLFGQPGMGGGNVPFGQDSGQAGLSQQHPFGAQTNWFAQNPFVTNPYQQSPQLHPTQHLVAVLGQLALQLAAHGAVTQQIGIALQQLTQQLGAQSPQGHPGGFGAGQAFAGVGPPYAGGGQPFGLGGGGQYFGQNPFAGAIQAGYGQGGYSGFNPQAQAWGANRPQTIQ